MIIQLLFIAAVGYLVVWCGTEGDPRTAVRQSLRSLRSRRTGRAPQSFRPGAEVPAAPGPVPRIETRHETEELTEARWNDLIARLDDLADLDHDLD